MENLPLALVYGLSALGAAVGIGLIGAASLGAMGRNPEAIGKLVPWMFASIAAAEALGILGFVLALMIMG